MKDYCFTSTQTKITGTVSSSGSVGCCTLVAFFFFFSNLIVSKYKHTFNSKHRNSFDKAQRRPEQTAEEKVKLIHTTQVLAPSCWSLSISDYSFHPWRPFLPSGSADGTVSVLLLRWWILGHTYSPSIQPPEAHLPPGLGVAPQK